MRMRWVTGVAVTIVVGCGSGDRTRGAPPAETSGPSAAGTAAAQPATPAGVVKAAGKTWDVKMLGDAQGYRFDPATLSIRQGDAIRWTLVSGSPHNVSFWSDSLPAGAAAALGRDMQNTVSPLMGPMLLNPNQTYAITFTGVPPGRYPFYCTPHLAMGMKGVITIQ